MSNIICTVCIYNMTENDLVPVICRRSGITVVQECHTAVNCDPTVYQPRHRPLHSLPGPSLDSRWTFNRKHRIRLMTQILLLTYLLTIIYAWNPICLYSHITQSQLSCHELRCHLSVRRPCNVHWHVTAPYKLSFLLFSVCMKRPSNLTWYCIHSTRNDLYKVLIFH